MNMKTIQMIDFSGAIIELEAFAFVPSVSVYWKYFSNCYNTKTETTKNQSAQKPKICMLCLF